MSSSTMTLSTLFLKLADLKQGSEVSPTTTTPTSKCSQCGAFFSHLSLLDMSDTITDDSTWLCEFCGNQNISGGGELGDAQPQQQQQVSYYVEFAYDTQEQQQQQRIVCTKKRIANADEPASPAISIRIDDDLRRQDSLVKLLFNKEHVTLNKVSCAALHERDFLLGLEYGARTSRTMSLELFPSLPLQVQLFCGGDGGPKFVVTKTIREFQAAATAAEDILAKEEVSLVPDDEMATAAAAADDISQNLREHHFTSENVEPSAATTTCPSSSSACIADFDMSNLVVMAFVFLLVSLLFRLLF